MTKATTEGRNLMLSVEGVGDSFIVAPLAAKRGKALTEQFVKAALGEVLGSRAESIFIESIGPTNYARMTGLYVDLVDFTGDDETPTEPYATYDDEGLVSAALPERAEIIRLLTAGAIFVGREAREGEQAIDADEIRQEEAEALCLCAFYWQTVVGMEGVDAFLEGGEGTSGSLKAMALLQIRLGLSTSPNSRSGAMENEILRRADSGATTDTPTSSASVRLPANKRGFLPKRNQRASSRSQR